jgi:hypothetical protein
MLSGMSLTNEPADGIYRVRRSSFERVSRPSSRTARSTEKATSSQWRCWQPSSKPDIDAGSLHVVQVAVADLISRAYVRSEVEAVSRRIGKKLKAACRINQILDTGRIRTHS